MNKEFLTDKCVLVKGSVELLDAVVAKGRTLGFKLWDIQHTCRAEATSVNFRHDGDMILIREHPSWRGADLLSLDEFFALKPEPKKKTITLEVTEEQEQLIRQQLGE